MLAVIVAALLGARSLANDNSRQSRTSFKLAAAQIVSTLKLNIRQEDDLASDAAVFFKEGSASSPAGFRRWVADAQLLERYPELIGISEIQLVPISGLQAWAARAMADPPTPSRSPFQVVPPGVRSYYCFRYAAVERAPVPIGIDACARSPLLYASRDSGIAYNFTVVVNGRKLFGASTPVYRAATPPRTLAARRASFLGWTGLIVRPQVMLANALRGQSGMSVLLLRSHAGAGLAFAAGRRQAADASTTIDLHDGSTVEVFGPVASASIFADGSALAVLISGALFAALLGLFLLSHARAMRLVGQKADELSFQALHDGLTSLPNRALVIDRAEQMLARARRTLVPVAVLFIDIDNFKSVNDNFGHAAGDQLLRVVAKRLLSVVRDGDTVGRLSGDEFVVLLEGHALYADPARVAERVVEALRQPVELEEPAGTRISISASVGIAVGGRESADELLRNSDLALYAAKQAGKDRYVFFEDAMQTAAAERLALELDLAKALDDDQLFLLYQPTFDLQSQVVTGVEALLRWRHPERGIVMPEVFIPIAEESGLIIPIGRFVLWSACAQAVDWQRQGFRIGMSINVSARQLKREAFIDEVAEALADSNLEPGLLTLEITETALTRDPDAGVLYLRALKALGVRVAIDDFGTGYSSLAYLRRFPVDAVKIDRSFISGLPASEESKALMHTLVQLGKKLGLETLGEGIEESAQLERLRREHCDSGQGFLFARPLPPESVEEFFEREEGSALGIGPGGRPPASAQAAEPQPGQ